MAVAAAMAAELVPDTVAERLQAEGTRAATLHALEALPPPVPRELAQAAAPALVDAVAGTLDREVLDRCGLLMARLMAEAAPDPSAIFGAAFAGDRFASWYTPRLIVEAVQRASETANAEAGLQPLTHEDVYSCACWLAWMSPGYVRGNTAVEAAMGRTSMESFRIVRVHCFIFLPSFPSPSPGPSLTHMACCAVGLDAVAECAPFHEKADAER